MPKKLKYIFMITIFVLGAYFIVMTLKDDAKEIEKQINSFDHPETNMVHIEFLDNRVAIAFYKWGGSLEVNFGSAIFEKGLFGWKMLGGGSSGGAHDYKLGWSFHNLEQYFSDYTDLLRGEVFDENIAHVKVVTENGNEYEAKIVEYNDHEKFWFLVTNGDDLTTATVTALSADGEIIEQIMR